MEMQYDSQGNCTQKAFYNTEGNLIKLPEWYAVERRLMTSMARLWSNLIMILMEITRITKMDTGLCVLNMTDGETVFGKADIRTVPIITFNMSMMQMIN